MNDTQHTLNPFVICKAAAGSGKTFTLVKEYLKLAMTVEGERWSDDFRRRLRSQFRGILAITFTNKAAGEMKGRIMDYLSQMAAYGTDPQRSRMGAPLLEALNAQPCYIAKPLSEQELQQMAEEVYSAVLHNYSDLSVSTIDSFMHRIVRTFAHDLNKPMDFEVLIDQEEMVNEAVEGVMAKVGTAGNEALTDLVQAFADSRMEEEKSFRLEGAMASLANQLFKEGTEEYVEALSKLKIKDFVEIHKSLASANRQFEQEARACGEAMMELLAQVGADEADCAGGAKGYYGFFRGLAQGNIRALTKSADENLAQGKYHSAKCDPLLREDLQAAAGQMGDIYLRTRTLLGAASEGEGEPLRDYHTRALLLKNLYSMALLGQLADHMQQYAQEHGVVHLSEFNRLINKIVEEEPTPFIYERLGNRYRHFLIDEFQDTSVLQWHNLVPLLENGVSQRKESLVVGDGKQAIYRFRQGDVRQFVDLPHVAGLPLHGQTLEARGNYSHISLDTNYRTASSIVNFNNRFFSWLLQQAPFADNELAQRIFVGELDSEGHPSLWQRLPAKGVVEGHVEVDFVDPDDPEALYEQIRLTIVRLVREQGYRFSDIMVLGRNKVDLDRVGAYLQAHSDETVVELSSSESFFLTRSHAAMAVVAALRWLHDNSDRVAAAELLQRLHNAGVISQNYADRLLAEGDVDVAALLNEAPEGFEFRTAYLMGLGLYDRCEELVRQLHLDGIDTPYVGSLLGRVASFVNRRNEGVGEFLEWFDDNTNDPSASNARQLSVSTSEGVDAVRMLTIHKAKGLEAPVVICPFFPPHWKPYRLWVPLEGRMNTGDKQLPAAFVELDSKHSSRFDEVRDSERQLDEVDQLNVLYVALTRPQEQLFVFCPTPSDKSSSTEVSYPRLLKAFVDKEGMEGGVDDFRHEERTQGGGGRQRNEVRSVAFAQWSEKVAVASPEEHLLDALQEEKKRFGTYAHALLSTVRNADEAAGAVARFAEQNPLSDSERERLERLLHEVLVHPDSARFFDSRYEVKNECDLSDGVSLGRPDRVVFTPDETWVVDFKTGRDMGEEHDRQVRRYCEAVRGMGYPAVSGWLLYVDDGVRVRPVAS